MYSLILLNFLSLATLCVFSPSSFPVCYFSSILSLSFLFLMTYLDTMLNISGSRGAASAGSLCMNVPNITMQSPISSSLYSSLTIPHSEHRCVTQSSPILKELCLVSVPSGLGDSSALNHVPGLLGS